MTRTDSLQISIDTEDFEAVRAEEPDERTFSVRAAEVRTLARQAIRTEAERIVAAARARIREEQLQREAELERVRGRNRADARKTAVLLVVTSIALGLWGAWAVGHFLPGPAAPTAAVYLVQ